MRGYHEAFEKAVGDFKSEYNHKIYRTEGIESWWLASPMGLATDQVYEISNSVGCFQAYYVTACLHLRPIVCIKTSVFKDKYESTLESNYIGEAINADKYGEEVLGYECDDPEAQKEAGAWRLFYQNKDYTYLISDNKIPLSNTLENLYTNAGWGDKTGADVSSIGQVLNPMLKDVGVFTSSNTNWSIKAVGYLTDPIQWEKYKGTDAIFAIGGPSLELFISSFDATSRKTNSGEMLRTLITTDEAGYVGVPSYTYLFSETTELFKPEYNYSIYYNGDHEGNQPMWCLSSPSGIGNVFDILGRGKLGSNAITNKYSFKFVSRPIVCIPTKTFNEKYKLAASIVTDGLMRHYDARNNLGNGQHLDTTTTWTDLSGHQDGIINGGAKFTEDCLQLDGEDDWVNLGEVNPDYMTVEATIKVNEIQTGEVEILCNYNAGGYGISLANGKPFAQIYINGQYVSVRSNKVLDVDKIHTITGTYDGENLRLYIDGVLNIEKQVSGKIGAPNSTRTVMAIGANPDGNVGYDCFANIDVYSARIYDRALSQEEIKRNIRADGIINQEGN